jgi:hypothetical protein
MSKPLEEHGGSSDGTDALATRSDEWAKKGYPPVQFITYATDDPDNGIVLDVSPTLEAVRHWMDGRSGFVYRVERLPEAEWQGSLPAYGNESFVEFLS